MRSPLPLIVGALLLSAPFATRGTVLVSACVAALALALAAVTHARRTLGSSLFLLVASLAIGAAITAAKRPHLPRPRLRVHAREVQGTLDRPCVTRDQRQQCTVTEPDSTRVALYFSSPFCPARTGDELRALATITPIQPTLNDGHLGPGASFIRAEITERGESASCEVVARWPTPVALVRRAGDSLRSKLDQGINRVFDARSALRARALLFGDDDALDPDVTASFRNTGLSHLLAVSGAHVALVAAALGWIVRKLAARSRWIAERGLVFACEALFALPAVTLFVCATGEAPSAVRALVMATLALLAKLTNRQSDGPSLLAASALLTVTVVPGWIEDVGWQLSIAASWALVSARRDEREPRDEPASMRERLRDKLLAIVRWTRDASIATARVSLLTLPIVASMSGRVPLTGLCANIVAAPIGEVFSLPLVLIAALTGAWAPSVGVWIAKPAAWALAAMFAIPAHATQWPLASVECWPPTLAQSAVWLTLVAAGLWAKRARTTALTVSVAIALVMGCEFAHRQQVHPRGRLQVTAIDVGQGDALLIDLPDGEAVLVDGGGVVMGADPGERVVVPALARRRRRRLAAVIASHPHPDHVNGLRAVLAWAQVDELWDTRQSEQWQGASPWLTARTRAESQGVRVRGPESLCGRERYFHGAVLEVLAPCRPITARESPNDASFVLRLSYGSASVLLPGDLEAHGERALLPRLRPVTALKLGHHGSRTSTTDPWLDALSPRIAIASAGHPSPFDHPHPTVIERLRKRGIPLWSTSERAMITLALFYDGRWESRDATGVVLEGR